MKSFKEYFLESVNGLPDIWYHGSIHRFDWFSPEYIGKGHDAQGPGYYFTNSEADAALYGATNIIKVSIDFNKIVPDKGRINRNVVERFIKASPNLEIVLSNYDENPNIAYRKLLNNIMNSNGPRDAYLTIWAECYRHSELLWMENMVKLGYTGSVVNMREGVIHAIIYDLNKVTRIK